MYEEIVVDGKRKEKVIRLNKGVSTVESKRMRVSLLDL